MDDTAERLGAPSGRRQERRPEKAAEDPDDERNLEAAELLDRLASTVDQIDSGMLRAYGELCEDLLENEAEQEALRAVGFHSAPQNAGVFVSALISKWPGRRRVRL